MIIVSKLSFPAERKKTAPAEEHDGNITANSLSQKVTYSDSLTSDPISSRIHRCTYDIF